MPKPPKKQKAAAAAAQTEWFCVECNTRASAEEMAEQEWQACSSCTCPEQNLGWYCPQDDCQAVLTAHEVRCAKKANHAAA